MLLLTRMSGHHTLETNGGASLDGSNAGLGSSVDVVQLVAADGFVRDVGHLMSM